MYSGMPQTDLFASYPESFPYISSGNIFYFCGEKKSIFHFSAVKHACLIPWKLHSILNLSFLIRQVFFRLFLFSNPIGNKVSVFHLFPESGSKQKGPNPSGNPILHPASSQSCLRISFHPYFISCFLPEFPEEVLLHLPRSLCRNEAFLL